MDFLYNNCIIIYGYVQLNIRIHIIYISFLVPSFIAQFNATEYEFDINIYSPTGTVVFEALFIINPNITVEYLNFDIIPIDEMVGESSVDRQFLINGTTPPLVIQQAPFQSMYLLTITTGSVLDFAGTMNTTFKLFAFVNISTGVVRMPVSNVTLHKIGKVLLAIVYIII